MKPVGLDLGGVVVRILPTPERPGDDSIPYASSHVVPCFPSLGRAFLDVSHVSASFGAVSGRVEVGCHIWELFVPVFLVVEVFVFGRWGIVCSGRVPHDESILSRVTTLSRVTIDDPETPWSFTVWSVWTGFRVTVERCPDWAGTRIHFPPKPSGRRSNSHPRKRPLDRL